jgi:hypothetical protein
MRGIGINLLVWNGALGPAEHALFPTLHEMGYDCVELPIFALDQLDIPATRAALHAAELHCTVSTALPAGTVRAPMRELSPAPMTQLHNDLATLGIPTTS